MRSNGTGVRQITATNGVIEWNADWQAVRAAELAGVSAACG